MALRLPEGEAGLTIDSIHRLTVEQYDGMARAGILGPDDRVELLEGWLVEKVTKNPPHRVATHQTRAALERLVPEGWYVDSQEPIVTEDSEPEPDVALIRGRTTDYVNTNPPAEHVGLVVEVADATLLRDRTLKARVYARAGIPSYWIVHLVDRRVEILTDPVIEGGVAKYATKRAAGEHEEVAIALDGAEIGRVAVRALLG